MKRNIFLILAVVLAGCQTISVDFEEGINPEIYFHRAQLAVDAKDYEKALVIYQKYLATNPGDLGMLVSAEYEIGFLNYKLGNRTQAADWLKKVEGRYLDPSQISNLPGWPRILAQKILGKIEPDQETQGPE